MSSDFTPEQKRYLEGFVSGLTAARAARASAPAKTEPTGPDAIHIKAQDRAVAAGGKLADQEKFKREQHPFDAYERLKEQAAKNEPPKPADNFRWRFYGLFYVAPAQSSYMCRLRIPNGILTHWQFAGVADLAERYGGGYTHVTTRANLQFREVEPRNAVATVEAIQDLGLASRGSGADNIRNVTGTPTAGIDPQELIDTRAVRARVALPYPQRPRALRPAAEIQRRVRRRRHHPGAGGHQRHRLPGGRGERRVRRHARRLVPAGARRDHRTSGFRARHRRDREAGGRDQGGRRGRTGVHRARRPHQPQQGAAQVPARRLGLRQVPRRGRSKARPQARSRAGRSSGAASLPSIAPRISACTRRSSRASTGSASCCRSAGSRQNRCAGLPPSRATSGTATSA